MKDISLDGKWKYFIDENSEGEEKGIWKKNSNKSDWGEVQIPCNWYTGLELDYNGIVWFARQLDVNPNWKGKIVRICFNGVDYYAKIWVNGEYVGFHEGYFGHFLFDITNYLDFDNPMENEIVLQVNAPFDEGFNKTGPFAPRKRQFKGGFSHWDCRPGSTSKKYGQDKGSGGIWDSVSLKISNKLYINHVKIVSKDIYSKKSNVQLIISVFNKSQTNTDELSLNIKILPKNFKGKEQLFTIPIKVLIQGDFVIERSIQIEKPKLWWTWDLGTPNLYLMNLTFESHEEKLDKWEGTFGIRSAEYKKDGWYLNGEKIYLRGANFFSNLWLSKMDDEAYAKTVSDVKEANLNFLRISYHVEKSLFYNYINETGIVLQQDFPTLWNYEYSRESVNAAVNQSKEMTIQLHNHPSIIIFSCWTEPSNEENHLMAKILKKHVDSEDLFGRLVWSESAISGHPFCGWYFGTKYGYLLCPGAPYPSEFGPQSLPSINSPTWNEENLDVKNNWPPNRKWEYHDSQNILNYHMSNATPDHGLKKMIEKTQAYQADNLKFSIEAFRRCKGKTHMFALFMFKDTWPSITWSIIDYFNLRKKAYHAVKEACSPVLCSFSLTKIRLPYRSIIFSGLDAGLFLWGPIIGMSWNEVVSHGQRKPIYIHIINDLINHIDVNLVLKGELNGNPFFERKLSIKIESSSSRLCFLLNLNIGETVKNGTIKIKAELFNKKSKQLLSTNAIELYVKSKWKRVRNSISHFIRWLRNTYYSLIQAFRISTID